MTENRNNYKNTTEDEKNFNHFLKNLDSNNVDSITFTTKDDYEFTIDEKYKKEYTFINNINWCISITCLVTFFVLFIIVTVLTNTDSIANHFNIKFNSDLVKVIGGLIITLSGLVFNNLFSSIQEYIFSKFAFSENNTQHKLFIQNRNANIKLIGNTMTFIIIITYIFSLAFKNIIVFFIAFLIIILILAPIYICMKYQMKKSNFTQHIPLDLYKPEEFKSIEYTLKENNEDA
ncbi:ABC-type multidrug transport system fused ATPase/permease subunit [Staphylococcus hominis]